MVGGRSSATVAAGVGSRASSVDAVAGAGWSGSERRSQSTMPHTASLQPPQPVVARVAAATSSTVRAPCRQQPTMSPLVTPLHRHTVARSGISVGLAAGTAVPATGRMSSCAGSAGIGVPRVYAATRSAATGPAPTHVAPMTRPSATTTSMCRPPSGSLSRTRRPLGHRAGAADAHRDDVEPDALDLAPRRCPTVGSGTSSRAADGSVSSVARRRAWSQPCAISPLPPSGGSAQSPIANTRASAGRRQVGADDDAARHVQAGPLREPDLRDVPAVSTSRSAGEHLAALEPHARRRRPSLTTASSVRAPTRTAMPSDVSRAVVDRGGGPVELAVHEVRAAVHDRDGDAAVREPAGDLEPEHARRRRRPRGGRSRWRRRSRARRRGCAARARRRAGRRRPRRPNRSGMRARAPVASTSDVVRVPPARVVVHDARRTRSMVTARVPGSTVAGGPVGAARQRDRRDVELAGDHLGQQHPVVRLVLLGAEHGGAEPAARVALVQVVDEPRADHAVPDHDHADLVADSSDHLLREQQRLVARAPRPGPSQPLHVRPRRP